MVSIFSDTDSTCHFIYLLISLVCFNILVSWKVVVWVIIGIQLLHRFFLLPNWLVTLNPPPTHPPHPHRLLTVIHELVAIY